MDATGLEGLELRYDRYLKGAPEKLLWTRDAKGKRLYPRVERPEAAPKEHYNLVLTIDSRIQHLVESHLKTAVKDKGAKGGFAIVMDPRTGEILALANEMGFDPNRFSAVDPATGKNKAITDCFDPGSTFKPFLAAAALEEGVVKETDMFNCENGNYAVADRVIHEAQPQAARRPERPRHPEVLEQYRLGQDRRNGSARRNSTSTSASSGSAPRPGSTSRAR